MNSITHLVGAALGLGGMVVLIVVSAMTGDGWKILSSIIYGASLFLLFLFSTFYHSFKGTTKDVFHRFDHIGIYLLIAGTYTPFCLTTLRDGNGPWILALVWSIAVFGITFKAVFGIRYNAASTVLYLISGWVIAFDLRTLYEKLPTGGFALLLGGGLLYTVGVYFFANERIKYHHEIWHLFVLAAASCHYACVLFYIIL